MGKCFALHQYRRPQRRTHGLQLPLNFQQIACWIVFLITALLNFFIVTQIQFTQLRLITFILFLTLYVCHAISHVTATLLDPSEPELRKLKTDNVPEFDRNIHAHVIENGRCHLCNIHTSSKMTKHCSVCNKCVAEFDHHCKWLNNCIGQRNYVAFIVCVCTALLIAITTSSLCITDIVLFVTNPQQLSDTAQIFINCTEVQETIDAKYCKKSILFIVFLVGFCISALGIACALIHLCCFHVYIFMLGISTYEYIVRSGTPDAPNCRDLSNWRCCRSNNMKENIYNNQPNNKRVGDNTVHTKYANESHNETNVGAFIGILINKELENRAKRMILNDRNKIHPETENI